MGHAGDDRAARSVGVLIAGFFVVELRSKAPLLPLRIFRLRTLAGSNVAGLLMGGAIFSQFFLLTLYMQEVLHYSAIKTGVAYIGLTLTIIAFSAVAQALVTRFGVRLVLPSGLALSTVALVLFARLPVHGEYWVDLFPAFLISGLGLALAFVPMSIGALTGVGQSDAGIASGLINTNQQVGGAIGVALATTVATTFTSHYVSDHVGTNAFNGSALTHGFSIAFYVLAGLAAAGAVLSAIMLESRPGYGRGRGRAGGRPRTGGGCMSTEVLERRRHDLTLQLTGLVHVRALLDLRGASAAEIQQHSAEIERLRAKLDAIAGS